MLHRHEKAVGQISVTPLFYALLAHCPATPKTVKPCTDTACLTSKMGINQCRLRKLESSNFSVTAWYC
jgi:hypothetical protein